MPFDRWSISRFFQPFFRFLFRSSPFWVQMCSLRLVKFPDGHVLKWLISFLSKNHWKSWRKNWLYITFDIKSSGFFYHRSRTQKNYHEKGGFVLSLVRRFLSGVFL